MNPPALRALIRRILLPIFIISLLISTGGSYLLLYKEGYDRPSRRRGSCLPRHARSASTPRHISWRS